MGALRVQGNAREGGRVPVVESDVLVRQADCFSHERWRRHPLPERHRAGPRVPDLYLPWCLMPSVSLTAGMRGGRMGRSRETQRISGSRASDFEWVMIGII